MRIVIDLQGLQRQGNRMRGIGRYSISLTKSLIINHSENEYILFVNSALFDLRSIFKEELQNSSLKVSYVDFPLPSNLNFSFRGLYSETWIATQLRSYAVSLLNADIILITSFFDGFKDSTIIDLDRSFNLPPIVAIIYDLIPLMHPNLYLNIDYKFKHFYHSKIKKLEELDGLLAISESSMNEAKVKLKCDHRYIFNISSACDERVFNQKMLPIQKDSRNFSELGKFILYTGATDPRKNLYRLVKAYSILPKDLIRQYKLVLTGPYSEEEVLLIKEWMYSFSLPFEHVIFLGYISDVELAILYRQCYLFIFPSLHEGFGLPVLEAMSCGAPVIASSLTSIPEVVGIKQALFDPYQVEEISSMIKKCILDKEFYNQLCINSVERSKLFSWKFTAEKALESLRRISKEKSYQKDISPAIYLDDMRSYNYNLLIRSISKSPLLNQSNQSQQKTIKEVSASIDLINSKTRKYSFRPNLTTFKTLEWRVEGPFDSSYSLAILNRNFALSLSTIIDNVSLHSTEGLGDYAPDNDFLKNNSAINKLYLRSKESNNKYSITTRNLYPPRVNDLDSIVNMMHAYGWEETMFPYKWVDEFNEYLDGLTVMSNEVKKILIDNGVSIPISVCGLGVDHIDMIRADSNITFNQKGFTFLHISSCFPRKGARDLLEAYGNSFTSTDDVSLIIKTFPNPHNNVMDLLNEYKNENSNYPHVIILDEQLSDQELKSLYLSCDVVVSPSYGEGFNLTVAESMRLGIPVITSGWGGQMDFCKPENCWLVDFEFEYSKTHFHLHSSIWAKPSVNHLSQLMSEIFNSSKQDVQYKVKLAKRSISDFTWKSVSSKNINFVERLITFQNVRSTSNIGWISTWNSRCGIASYSDYIISHMKENITILAPFDDCLVKKQEEKNVTRCWHIGRDELDLLYDEIIVNKLSSVVIQFNYGFFDFLSFKKLIKRLSQGKINIILFLHSTIDPSNNSDKELITLYQELKLCSRILVHTPADLNRLKRVGLVSNVALFPHGVTPFRKKVRKPFNINLFSNRFHITSYGFCLPNKGFPELIQAFNIMRNNGFHAKLTIYSAMYNSEISSHLISELNSLISEFKLGKLVKVNSKFLTDNQSIENLANSDLVVFPYQATNESSSAAVRKGIASLTPVAVTPLPIFDDVLGAVHSLPGNTPELIADGIMDWVQKEKYKSHLDSVKPWIEAHDFSKLAKRLEGLINSLEINNDTFDF